jgi:hypothetical protein
MGHPKVSAVIDLRRWRQLGMRVAFASLLALTGCRRDPDPEVAVRASFVARQAVAGDAGAAWHLTSSEEIFFDNGWFPMETLQKDGVHGEAWRWMGRESLVRLRNHAVPMRLVLTGLVPLDLLGAPPLLTFRWNGKRVEAFLAPAGHFTKTMTITPAMQTGSTLSDFTIESTSAGRERDGLRDLGYALADIRWEPIND